jgi:hypothetical protein
MRKTCFLTSAMLVFTAVALAKRLPPPDVAPVLHNGRRYEVPHFNNPCGQNGGCVVAYDAASNEELWHQKVYCTKYDEVLERDVQDVFITSLQVEGSRLRLVDEKSRTFFLEMNGGSVSGAKRGCDSGGCSYGRDPHPIGGLSLLVASAGALAFAHSRRQRTA